MVKVLPGRRANPPGASSAPSEPEPDLAGLVAGGKGRPTPRRRDAESARRTRAKVPTTRKEAQTARRARLREEQQQRRAGLLTGDERYLPERDRGPVKRYVRESIDSHRHVAEYVLPFVLAATFISYPLAASPSLRFLPNFVLFGALAVVLVDSLLTSRSLRRGITERFGAEKVKGALIYGVLRSTQFRRLRSPRPQIGPGSRRR